MFRMMKLHAMRVLGLMVVVAVSVFMLAVPESDAMADSGGVRDMYRLYNPNSGEHFYTADGNERNSLVNVGWTYEGIGWRAPVKSSVPVYRLYNPNAGDHHYTLNSYERDSLVRAGWRYEGIGWYSSDTNRAYPLYRQYNPNAKSGAHNYTLNRNEVTMLVKAGWKDEGLAWYGVGGGAAAPQPQYRRSSGGAYPNLGAIANLNIDVSIADQRVYVKSGPTVVYTMIASTGMNDATPRGTFRIGDRGGSFYNASEGMGANYWVAFEPTNMYLFHSVPTDVAGRYIVSEGNKLGHPASHGCVRLSIPDAQWFYGVPRGTVVNIH
ncbi:L,D-transpeptidase family protein [Bifidobacterium simiiventris]|uniref:L,D-transpeptidase family protein n=1 Tax=Bifidobacterium simiiventris TaxID=2834434 RepID=UPI001C56DDB8|nr:L,D-transpeptidase family protein [Bifidobacterium simiiventris]MBW3079656.1 L,D-transpeptidase [Bifidobacterium simiiventris]